MGLILDSSVVIAAERRGDTPEQLVQQVIHLAGNQEAALSSVGLTELVHGIYRANSAQRRLRRQSFVEELRIALTVYPYTSETAMIAGRIDGEQTAKGVSIPLADLLIGATALSLAFSVLTVNIRHFNQIPGLNVIPI
jgi:predicted nucleic acid-binding protein